MKNAKEMFEFMATPAFSSAVQQIIENDRRAEIAFRQDLVDAFNRQLESAGVCPPQQTLAMQKQFIALSMPTAQAHAIAAHYAEQLGRQLPPPPPSLMLDDM